MPCSIVQIPKHLSIARCDEFRRVDAMGATSNDEIVNRRIVTFAGVIDQAEVNAD